MTPLEAKALVICIWVLCLGSLAWGLITIWHRRRRPEPRQEPMSMAQMVTAQEDLNYLLGQRRVVASQLFGPTVFFPFVESPLTIVRPVFDDPDDWLADDPPTWEFPEKWWPPSTLFNQHHARPWAHA